MSHLSPDAVRAKLDHPVIDADGHIIEFLPAIETGLERRAFQELLENSIEEATMKLEQESPGT